MTDAILPATSLSLAPATPDRAADLRKAAEGFEAILLSTLLKGGRAGLPGDDLTGSAAVRGATSMLDAHLATAAAGRSGFGIADAVVRQFSRPGESE